MTREDGDRKGGRVAGSRGLTIPAPEIHCQDDVWETHRADPPGRCGCQGIDRISKL